VTAQVPDRVVWDGCEFALAGFDGGPLFEPASYGLEVRAISSACWRGYHCRYDVSGGELVLTSLAIGTDSPPDSLFGAAPEKKFGEVRYEPVSVLVPFTGGLLLGDGFVRELYVHMGFHPAWKYTDVHELILESGRLVAHHDRSAAMAEIRAQHRPLRPGSRAADDIRSWVESTFDRSYVRPD
jgi:hypothetical protein